MWIPLLLATVLLLPRDTEGHRNRHSKEPKRSYDELLEDYNRIKKELEELKAHCGHSDSHHGGHHGHWHNHGHGDPNHNHHVHYDEGFIPGARKHINLGVGKTLIVEGMTSNADRAFSVALRNRDGNLPVQMTVLINSYIAAARFVNKTFHDNVVCKERTGKNGEWCNPDKAISVGKPFKVEIKINEKYYEFKIGDVYTFTFPQYHKVEELDSFIICNYRNDTPRENRDKFFEISGITIR